MIYTLKEKRLSQIEVGAAVFLFFNFFQLEILSSQYETVTQVFLATILFSASSSGVPWKRIFPSNSR